ncbi:nuclear transport factor 2 family protein [Aquabacterium sp.]|uniref:nuclear transport factor 2 family protein n=1 Tax=Aquabacterium sp. TaxID=1872578 RepID=UPI002B8F871E|nr:nuclear transport factor 2 family protein [Aquabacterium sp.]HSW03773.1 nuclear transport factor 2 family protein [Aquabacterium sp.]
MSETTYVQECSAITEVLNKYLEGNAKGSSAAMKPAFHEKATIFGLHGTELVGPEIQKLYDIVDTLTPSPNARTAIARIDVAGTAANARVDSDNVAGYCFSDFFNLLKIDGKWVIVNKVYHTRSGT